MENLEQLIVADKFRECLPVETRNYLVLQEGNGWFKVEKLAELADLHASLPGQPSNPQTESSWAGDKKYRPPF